MRHRLTFIFLLLLTISKAHAQNIFKNPSLSVRGFYGSFLTNLPKAQYLRDSYSYFGEVSLVQQTNGHKEWQVANRLPQVGMAAFFGNTGSKQYMGTMAGVFPFVAWTLFKTKTVQSSLRAGAGLGWIQKPYDKLSNHKNVLIGTHGNAYINFLWQAEAPLFSKVHMIAGLSFSHFSNGSSTLPNLGLNIPALSIGLRYGITKDMIATEQKKDSLRKQNTIFVFTTVGLKQYPWIESERYFVNTLQAEWSRQFRPSGKYAAGAVVFYDPSLEVNRAGILDQKRATNKIQAGLYVGYEHFFGRLSIPLQLGAYIYQHDIYSTLFQQLGFRYRMNEQWSAQLAMKTHAGKADFIHLGVGYSFK